MVVGYTRDGCQSPRASYYCTDGGSGVTGCGGLVADGAFVDTASVGATTFTVDAVDGVGNAASASHYYQVHYDFSGFFGPVANPPLNEVAAGAGVPVKFSLGGDQGLGVLAEGYPKSLEIECNSSAPLSDVDETVTTGSIGLAYDAVADQYVYRWKTDKTWAGSCRRLVLKLFDGTRHEALFLFR